MCESVESRGNCRKLPKEAGIRGGRTSEVEVKNAHVMVRDGDAVELFAIRLRGIPSKWAKVCSGFFTQSI
jgi:hypothetical protein